MSKYGMTYSEVESAHDAYNYYLSIIEKDGALVQTRNEWTKEVLNAAVLIKNPRKRIINAKNFKLPFILQEGFDILNENQPRVMHSREFQKLTMGFDNNIMFFGNENRQANARHSLYNIKRLLEKDKNSRKAILSFSTRHATIHYPCLIYMHFMIRDNKLHATLETRGTSLLYGWPNDVFYFTILQELMLGWLKESYPNLEMGVFLYKTVSLHYFCDKDGTPKTDTKLLYDPYESGVEHEFDLSHGEYVREMGALYFYVDSMLKASEHEDIDNAKIITYNDVLEPRRDYFITTFFYKWAKVLYEYHVRKEIYDFVHEFTGKQ